MRTSISLLLVFALVVTFGLARQAATAASEGSNFQESAEAATASSTSSGELPQTATFSMYCYWTGEATLGRVPGVLSSRIGHFAGKEIVQVDFDPGVTDLAELTQALKRQKSFYGLLVPDEAARTRAESFVEGGAIEDGDIEVVGGKPHFIEPKHSLRTRHPEMYALDLTEEQAIALNSWSYFGGRMPNVLTTKQEQQLEGNR